MSWDVPMLDVASWCPSASQSTWEILWRQGLTCGVLAPLLGSSCFRFCPVKPPATSLLGVGMISRSGLASDTASLGRDTAFRPLLPPFFFFAAFSASAASLYELPPPRAFHLWQWRPEALCGPEACTAHKSICRELH